MHVVGYAVRGVVSWLKRLQTYMSQIMLGLGNT